MNIQITIENKIVAINLLDKKRVIDGVIISEEHRLSEDLLPTINKLLKDNNLETQDIAKITLQSDMGDNFTTHRIAAAVTNAFNWANKN
jgi:tRNA A37 threonylcarbamoyladenosine modification protein TsaB